MDFMDIVIVVVFILFIICSRFLHDEFGPYGRLLIGVGRSVPFM